MIDRRALIRAGALAMLVPAAARGQSLSVRPWHRVIIDNDFSGDPDGLFQLAHQLLSPSTLVSLVIGSHIHENDFLDKSTTQADNAVRIVHEMMGKMRLERKPEVIAGRNAAPAPGARPEATPAVRQIIAEALREDSKLPLFYVAGAGLTDLAEAVRIEPRIAPRLKLVWIGGPEHAELRPGVPVPRHKEYNITIDLAAAQTIFNESAIEIWQIPRDAYRTLLISHAELEGLRGTGALGSYLLAQLERVIRTVNYTLGETYVLGDSPLVTLTSLQSSFEPDSSSSEHVLRPTPRITDQAGYAPAENGRPMRVYTRIDARLTFEDMFAKFRAASL